MSIAIPDDPSSERAAAPGSQAPETVGRRPAGQPSTRRLPVLALAVAVACGTLSAFGAWSPRTIDSANVASSTGTESGFTAGDIVVYRVGDGSSSLSGAGTPVFLDEYSPSGSLISSVALPTTGSGSNKPLVASGSATSEGGLTLSADGRYLVATGYDTAVGASGVSSTAAASVPRTIARVDASGTVDTSTALTDYSDGNNPRSAVSNDGSEFWVGGAAGGVRYAPLGASTSTSLVSSTYKNVRQLAIADGQLYTSADPTKASVTVATVGSGLPTTGSQAVTNLPFASSPAEPYSYALLTLGTGSTPDTLYIADNSAGAVVKYGLVSGSWVQQGSVIVANVTGLTANDSGGTVTIYATSSGGSGTAGTLYKITDSSGTGGTLSGSASVLATAPANEAFRGTAFAPGTVIGSGGGSSPTTIVPTLSPAHTGLPAALGDSTNPSLAVTVGDVNYTADQLSLTASSSDGSVAPAGGISVTGDGADRTLTVTPGVVGYSTITLTVTAPDGTSTSTQIRYGVSADLGDASERYYSGAGNASAAIDVGDGYMVVGDDEKNVLRLYDETQSGTAVRSFDFTSRLPFGDTEVDIEAAARSGDTLYWTGSMSNNSSGQLAPARSTLFAAKITGSGANTQLTYLGSYTGLQSDLASWDQNNGHGLGANYFGFYDSVNTGIGSHEVDAFNVEGMEFAGSSTSTAYLAFRAPLEPTSDRHLALLVPVTDIDQLVADGNPGSTHATFGAPILMDLGGRGIRDIKENADGQYLIIAGTADDANSSFALYSWDGKPSDPPLETGTTLPLEPSGANQGSWEAVVSVPEPLIAGARVRLLEDNGDTAWYGDSATSKDSLPADLQKDLGQVFTYTPGTPLTTATALSVAPSSPTAGQTVTYTAAVTGPGGTLGTPTGTVEFVNGGNDVAGCAAQPLSASGVATCQTAYSAAGSQTVSAQYGGDGSFAGSLSAGSTLAVTQSSATVALVGSASSLVTGQSITYSAVVAAPSGNELTPSGSIEFRANGSDLPGCAAVPLGTDGTAQCIVAAGFAPSQQKVEATYSGDAAFTAAAAAPLTVNVAKASTVIAVTSSANPSVYGTDVVIEAQVTATAPGSGTPTGTVQFTLYSDTHRRKIDCGASGLVKLSAGTAICVLSGTQDLTKAGSFYTVTADYSGDAGYQASGGSGQQQVGLIDTKTKVKPQPRTPSPSQSVTVSVAVEPKVGTLTLADGQLTVTVTGADGSTVACGGLTLSGVSATCTIAAGALNPHVGAYTITAVYSGSDSFAASSDSATVTAKGK
jgi:hypothetical protein